MAARVVPLRRWARRSLAASAPLGLAFLVLAVLDLTPPVAAALAWACLSLLAAAVAGLMLRDVGALARYVEASTGSEGGPGHRPAPAGLLTRELAASVERLARLGAEGRARLAGERAELERAFDALPEPLLLLDGERKIVRANRAAELLLGGELAGRHIAASLRNPQLIEAVEQTIEGAGGRDVEFTLPAPVERTFSARVEPLPEPREGGAAVLLALVDFTAVRRTDQMRADFVANASHEIRTPLATLMGFIETLQGSARDDAAARERFLTIMDQHGKRMARLVEDLLSLSRIEMNEHTPPTDAVPLPSLLANVYNTLAWRAEKRGVTVAIDAEEGLPPVIGDGDELTQVFLNLVDNAIKYGDAEGAIRVEARRTADAPPAGRITGDEGAVSVSVADRGAGIPREHLPRLTERFYRVDKARSRELGGTGLGLAIVKHIVNRHRGALTIDSTPGEGSTFTVYLQPAPVAEDAVLGKMAQPAGNVPADGAGRASQASVTNS